MTNFFFISLNIEDEEDNEDIIIDNDGDAAEHIVAKFGENMINCNNVRYIKNRNIWTCDEKILKATLLGGFSRRLSKDGLD